MFIRAALIGSLLFMLLCAGAILVGQSHPARPELFKYLTTCDGQPCYLGVVPGKTSWDDTVAIFEDTSGIRFDPDIDLASNPPGFRGSALIYSSWPDDTIFEGATLSLLAPDINIGLLVEQFGLPCLVGVTSNAGTFIYFPHLAAQVWTNQFDVDQSLHPTTPVQSIDLVTRFCDDWSSLTVNAHPWKGFVRYTN